MARKYPQIRCCRVCGDPFVLENHLDRDRKVCEKSACLAESRVRQAGKWMGEEEKAEAWRLRAEGVSLEAIGLRFGRTRQAIQQTLARMKRAGFTGEREDARLAK